VLGAAVGQARKARRAPAAARARAHRRQYGFFQFQTKEKLMGNKIVTEADRKRTPAPKTQEGISLTRHGRGQKISLERGVSTRSKKNPGKRPHKGG
jgi:hypothetical protein